MQRALWTSQDPQSTQIFAFKTKVEWKYGLSLAKYEDLYAWTVQNPELFWHECWHHVGIRASKSFSSVFAERNPPMYPRPSFFINAKLNFAENLLYPTQEVDENQIAIIESTENSHEQLSWKELRERVQVCFSALRKLNVRAHDRIAGYVGNHADAVVLMLATTALGAIWTGVSTDTGAQAVLDRLQQIEPKVLFADSASIYNGKSHSIVRKIEEVAAGLPSLEAVVCLEPIAIHSLDTSEIRIARGPVIAFHTFRASADAQEKIEFAQLDPDHPVYILYSSGTTGKPKCIVHGAIGTLITHKKEHILHCDMYPGGRLFYFTTTTWMMWQWLVSGLASGVTIVLFDGSPFRPLDGDGNGDLAMARLIDRHQITHFGTSAKYLSILEQKDVMPREKLPLGCLKAIYSTAAPLAPSTFEYVYRAFGSSIHLASITGGTDIISLFGAPSPISPVFRGEIQVRGLGLCVEVFDHSGKIISKTGEAGDLVCTKPFPCQPVAFWGTNGAERYRKSYFSTFEGVWYHGDFCSINPMTGGLVMLGRSDGILKPAGVRFGSAEIYNTLLKDFAAEIDDGLCVGRRRPEDTDETVVLFLKMKEDVLLDRTLIEQIKKSIRNNLSARHVPGLIDQCPEIPVTVNGKKVEIAVKQILCGTNIKISASVANAHCLDWYREWAETH